jgi:hypothetical protein
MGGSGAREGVVGVSGLFERFFGIEPNFLIDNALVSHKIQYGFSPLFDCEDSQTAAFSDAAVWSGAF